MGYKKELRSIGFGIDPPRRGDMENYVYQPYLGGRDSGIEGLRDSGIEGFRD